MTNYPKSITEQFRDVVQIASDTDLYGTGQTLLQQLQAHDNSIVALNYQYGPVQELQATLASMNAGITTPAKRFPLIWLVEDITIDRRNADQRYGTTSLRLVIAHKTKAEYKSQEREENVFAPVLRPIYYNLLYAIGFYGLFSVADEEDVPHRVTERKNWATDNNAQQTLTTAVDAIDIQDLQLKINFQHSYTPLIDN